MDFEHRGGPLVTRFAAQRSKRARALPTLAGPYPYEASGRHRIQVKILDLFGN